MASKPTFGNQATYGSTVIPKGNTPKTQFFLDYQKGGGGGYTSPIDTANNAQTGPRPSGSGGSGAYVPTSGGFTTGSSGGGYSGGGYSDGGGYGYSGGGGGGGSYGVASTGVDPLTGAVVDLTAPYTGFASRYTPGSADMLFGNPNIILKDVVRDMGMPGDGGGYFMAQPYMNYANALFALANGGNTDMANGANDVGINFLADYARNLLTPGGEAVQFDQGLNALQNAAPGSMLDNLLNLAAPEDQVKNYSNLVNALTAASSHPLWARAMQSFLADRGTDFMSSMARGEAKSNFGNYLGRRQGPFDTR